MSVNTNGKGSMYARLMSHGARLSSCRIDDRRHVNLIAVGRGILKTLMGLGNIQSLFER